MSSDFRGLSSAKAGPMATLRNNAVKANPRTSASSKIPTGSESTLNLPERVWQNSDVVALAIHRSLTPHREHPVSGTEQTPGDRCWRNRL